MVIILRVQIIKGTKHMASTKDVKEYCETYTKYKLAEAEHAYAHEQLQRRAVFHSRSGL